MIHPRTRQAILILVSLSLLTSCKPATTVTDPYRDQARAIDAVAATLKKATQIKRELAHNGTITPSEEKSLTVALLAAVRASKATRQALVTLRESAGTETGQMKVALTILKNAVTEVDATVLRIRNPQSKQKLTTVLATITASLRVIESSLGGHSL